MSWCKTIDGTHTIVLASATPSEGMTVTGNHLALPATPIDLTGISALTLVATYPISFPTPNTLYHIHAAVTFTVDHHTDDLGTLDLRFIPDGGSEATLARGTHSGAAASNDDLFALTGGGLQNVGAVATGEIRLYANRVELRVGDTFYFSHIAFPHTS